MDQRIDCSGRSLKWNVPIQTLFLMALSVFLSGCFVSEEPIFSESDIITPYEDQGISELCSKTEEGKTECNLVSEYKEQGYVLFGHTDLGIFGGNSFFLSIEVGTDFTYYFIEKLKGLSVILLPDDDQIKTIFESESVYKSLKAENENFQQDKTLLEQLALKKKFTDVGMFTDKHFSIYADTKVSNQQQLARMHEVIIESGAYSISFFTHGAVSDDVYQELKEELETKEKKLRKYYLKQGRKEQGITKKLYDFVSGFFPDKLDKLRKSAESGDVKAQFDLGRMYDTGQDVEKNDTESAKWYRLAAEQRNADAQNNLGVFYLNGRGVGHSDVEAVKWFKKSAEQGNLGGQASLGYMYEQGKGVEQNNVEAIMLYRLAAEQGNAHAQNNLGLMYRSGKGVEKDTNEGKRWLEKAAAQGHEGAQSLLAADKKADEERTKRINAAIDVTLENIDREIERLEEEKNRNNAGKTHDLLKRAEAGDVNAQFILGNTYTYGLWAPKNMSEGERWLKKAAAQGHEASIKLLKEKHGYK